MYLNGSHHVHYLCLIFFGYILKVFLFKIFMKDMQWTGLHMAVLFLNSTCYFFLLRSTSILLLIITSTSAVYSCLYIIKGIQKLPFSNNDLCNKVIIVTGGNRGIGYHTVEQLLARGGTVIVACRDPKLASKNSMSKWEHLPGNAVFMELDLANVDSIRSFVNTFLASKRPLHVLINNAGIMLSERRYMGK